MQRERIFVKTSMALKPQIFSPANLSLSTVTDFRSMTKHGNSVKLNLSLHNKKVASSLNLHHIRGGSKLYHGYS